jgi:hypothetical protein
MFFIKLYKRALTVTVGIFCAILFFTTCIHNEDRDPVIAMPDGNHLVGSLSCRNCHAAIYDSFISTAHYLTSKPAIKKYVKGNFDKNVKGNFDKNMYVYTPYEVIAMNDSGGDLYQVEYQNGKLLKAYKMDVVVGSGTRGQSFLYWKGDQLYQLPVSYYTLSDSWSNSPGYPDYYPVFTRPVNNKCLGCHSSYAKILPDNKMENLKFDHEIVYGVNCERCHGPGGNHVDFYSQHSNEKNTKNIVNAARLSRRQQVDACAICHSSGLMGSTNGLSFKTGDTLDHKMIQLDTTVKLDVHRNQYGLLTASKCFRISGSLTCSTCHNVHQQERGNLSLFAQRCMTCHSPEKQNFCKMSAILDKTILMKNCIDCHMPKRESHALTVKVSGNENHTPAVIRTHYITVYPEDAKKIEQIIKGESSKR